MNTANLQLEGLLIAIASMNDLLVSKGIIGRHEIGHAMDIAEQTVLGDYRTEQLDAAQRDAIVFPIRLLRLSNNGATETEIMPFSDSPRWSARPRAATTTKNSIAEKVWVAPRVPVRISMRPMLWTITRHPLLQ